MIATTQAPPRRRTQRIYGALPSTWVAGINFENTTIPSGMVTFMNYDTTASGFFIKHAEFELKHAGESAPLAKFLGQIDVQAAEQAQTIQNFHILLRDSDVAHGMTALIETDILGAIGFRDALEGGLNILGFTDEASIGEAGLVLQGITGTAPGLTDDASAAVLIEGWKKNGTNRAVLGENEPILRVNTGSGAGSTSFLVTGKYAKMEKGLSWSHISPAQITANQNNYDPWAASGDAVVLRVSSDAERGITGLAGGFDGRVVVIMNAGSNRINLSHLNGNSSAANQFDFSTSAQISLLANGDSVTVWYDTVINKWRDIGNAFGL